MFDQEVIDRVAELERLRIMDTSQDPVLDDIVKTAALVADAPISLLTLIDDKRQWFKATYGLARGESDLGGSICARVIMQDQVLIVPDATADPRFMNNPFVVGEPRIRFYAGAPVVTANGVRLGALSVIDIIPHPMTPFPHVLMLQKLARLASYEIERSYPGMAA